MNNHHLVLGTCTDYLTGEELEDTHDERYRQSLARRLVEGCGFSRSDIAPRQRHPFDMEGRQVEIGIDFVVTLAARKVMIVKYAPGSLVTRHRPALAASRVLAPYQIPRVVVTNGQEADILDGSSGRILASGLDAVPMRSELAAMAQGAPFAPIDEKTATMARRILYAFEIHGTCLWKGDPP